jgi:protein-arginine deiminase
MGVPCAVVVTLVVAVRDAVADAPLDGVTVRVTPSVGGVARVGTTAGGSVRFEVSPGTYDVEAAKDWHLPEPVRSAGKVVPADPQVTRVDLDLQPLFFYLHVDADRDGQVDDDRTGLDAWQWGAGRKGAVVLCNCDDDDPDGWPDNEDEVVNGGNDAAEVAPLEVRKHGSNLAVPGTWTATLSVPHGYGEMLRVLAGRAQGDAEVIGRTQGRSHDVVDLDGLRAAGARTYGMEALRYAGEGFADGLVDVTLRVEKPARADGRHGPASYASTVQVRVAPWIVPNHRDRAHTVYVAGLGADNDLFRQDLQPVAGAAGCTLREVVPGGNDRWLQDCMEIGYSVLPGHPRPHRVEVVMRAHRNRGLGDFPVTLLDADRGFYDPAEGVAIPPTTFDSTGNLEVTPPVRDRTGKAYPWGRIYYGNGGGAFNAETRRFLEGQVVQAPIQLDTDWLLVGHVDEMMSFVPAAGAQYREWRLLVASPRRAYDILENDCDPGWPMLVGRDLDFGAGDQPVGMTVDEFLNGDTAVPDTAPPYAPISSGDMRRFNEMIQTRIEGVIDQLRDDIDLQDGQIIDIPVIFIPENAAWTTAGALTADMVNMLVVNDHCFVPYPYGPRNGNRDLFEEAVTGALGTLGLTVHWVRDWYPYHAQKGEVHCGTNTLRRPAAGQPLQTWLQSVAARWWEFQP